MGRVADAIPFSERSLGRLLLDSAQALPDTVWSEVDGVARTWAQVAEAAGDVAAVLRAAGVAPGDVVAQMTGNVPEHVDVLFGIALAGAVECPVNTRLRGEALRHVLTHSTADVLFVEAEHAPRVAEALSDAEGPSVIVVVDAEGPLPEVGGDRRVLRLAEADRTDGDPRPAASSEPATIIYTSGTTGPAKGVVLPHNFAFNTAVLKAGAWGLSSDDVLFSTLPLFHANARFSTLLTGAVIGARSVVVRRFSASAFWDQARAAGATEIGVVGTIPAILLAQPPSERDADHAVRCMHGAGSLSVPQRKVFEERFGVRLVVGFAMSETSHFLSTSPDDPLRYAGSGKPLPSFDVEIVDDDDRLVGPQVTGELVVRPREPFVMFLEYFNNPDATLAAFRNLWFHTGDLGHFDEHGYFHWEGRKKEALRRGGEMISAHDVEHALEQHETVAECAAVGVPSDLGEDEVMVYLVLEAETELDFEQLHDHCKRLLADFAVPRFYAVVDDLPRTATHKIAKHELSKDRARIIWDAGDRRPRRNEG